MLHIDRTAPLLLRSITESYLIREGALDLFVVGIHGEKPGRRFYAKTLAKGELLRGGTFQLAGSEESFSFVAVATNKGAVLERKDRPVTSDEEDSLRSYCEKAFEWDQKSIKRSMAKEASDQRAIHQVFQGFVTVVNKKAKDQELCGSTDPLYKAFQLVTEFSKISIIEEQELSGFDQEKIDVDFLAKVSNVNLRTVILTDKWHRQDNGPILGYMEEDHRPVALIPAGPSSYTFYDIAKGVKGKLTDKIAEEIEPQGVIFYRSFPSRKLNLLDILKFGSQACWKKDVISIGLWALIAALLGLIVPVVTKALFDTYIVNGEKFELLQAGFMLIGFLVGKSMFELIRSFAMLRVEGKMEAGVQSAVWDRLLALPVSFFKDYTAGELAMRAFGISQIRELISGVFASTLITGAFSILYVFQVAYYGKQLAIYAVIMLALLMAFSYFLGKIQMKFERINLELKNHTSGLVLQLLNAIAKFRVTNSENRAFQRWAEVFTRTRKIDYRKETITTLLTAITEAAPVLFSFVFYLVAVNRNLSLDLGSFIAFTTAFGALSEGMITIIMTVIQINVVKPMYEMSKPILEALPEYDDGKDSPGELTGDITVSHVKFRYEKGAPLILDDVSLHIKKGEYVALVGPSGSGKSTLFRLLLGFEKPESGQVYYNDMDLATVNIKEIRRQLGVVIQNGQLMSGDIFTNIIGANTQLTMEDAERAAAMAGLTEDIEKMPMGMHTVVSEGAATLSGGQKQRILIARAIVHSPRILYFDEATSALDNRTQKIVQDSLDSMDSTRVVIAHRLSTVMNCDRIIVIDKGRVVESGSYDELLKQDGVFKKMAERQIV